MEKKSGIDKAGLFKGGKFTLHISPMKRNGDPLTFEHPKHPGKTALIGVMGANIISTEGGYFSWDFGFIPSSDVNIIYEGKATPTK